jgi:hypothetical protein
MLAISAIEDVLPGYMFTGPGDICNRHMPKNNLVAPRVYGGARIG